ncbi:hypothetical protein [Elizabethkingia anophelis]|uniref:hypothetical protein n=1 Tax=Elizabethkingia anophelis TaxID=1117645 RepID=UPI0013188087|nr:hypothetical protein [Elizabethkingia anophelis]BBQ07952.1 hypothetical protein JUNP353_2523 [Elizabethkingia anophelis]
MCGNINIEVNYPEAIKIEGMEDIDKLTDMLLDDLKKAIEEKRVNIHNVNINGGTVEYKATIKENK